MNSALTIGINYKGSECELYGCLNDARDWAGFLKGAGFRTSSLLEKQATRANILKGIAKLIKNTKAGETSVITYSGHGTWVPDREGDEPDGHDEALCPYDLRADGVPTLIIDDELHLLFNEITPGATIVFLTDCCHSGSVFRFAPSTVRGAPRARFLPPSHFLTCPKAYARMELVYGQQGGQRQAPLPGLVHISACKDNEYACDAVFKGRPSGAFTHYALMAFKSVLKGKGTYADAYRIIRSYLPSMEYRQSPVFNALPSLKKSRLLLQ